jgi:hypothetical protein
VDELGWWHLKFVADRPQVVILSRLQAAKNLALQRDGKARFFLGRQGDLVRMTKRRSGVPLF